MTTHTLPIPMKNPLRHLIIMIAALLATSGADGKEEDLDARVLATYEIKPDAESIRGYLKSIADDKALTAKANALFAQLSSDVFLVRQAAERKLRAMPHIPGAALKKALTSDNPETVMIASKLAPAQASNRLGTTIGMFACMRTIAAKSLEGLVPEILEAIPNAGTRTAREAAREALIATARPTDLEALRAAREHANGMVRATVKEYFAWQEGEGKDKQAPPAWTTFFDGCILNGKGEGGHKTEFIKGIPPQIQACFGRQTKTASTISSVADRRKTSPWLYPEKQWGEIPKVLEKDGKRYYPLWGTWHQQWSQKTIRLNENGSVINGAHSSDNNIHLSSTVDFIVVPIQH